MRLSYKILIFAIFLISGFYILRIKAPNESQTSELSLSEKVQNLMKMSNKKHMLRFNGQQFMEYVDSSPRNYSMVVMMTALKSSRKCQICREVKDEFQIVVQSYYRFSPEFSNKLFFAMVDYDEGGSEVFEMFGLNAVPAILHFPAKGKPEHADTMDMYRYGFTADVIGNFVAERTDIQIRIIRPSDNSYTIVTLVALVGVFLYMRRNNLEFLYSKPIWGSLAVFFCFTMISGHMWNHIRDPPILHTTQNGDVYIDGSTQRQLVAETYIVLGLYALIFFGILLLTESGSQTNQRKGRFMSIIGLAFLTIFFSLLLSVFRTKNKGYPYRFLFE